eukprot:TRINITY_DN56418_c0_g3_i1.p1 TRINITY_DN56418_c0_g3~~TRINITY_DN56418_c0_g3_i1.p1  ORF type:complete len:262 (-),score=-0.94 TRINITY_DN56418_c0_g3_i1:5-790(-)
METTALYSWTRSSLQHGSTFYFGVNTTGKCVVAKPFGDAEASTWTALSGQQGIIPLLDIVTINSDCGNGFQYMVMPEETPLRIAAGLDFATKEISDDQCKKYATGILQGLASMHSYGWLHHDVKPGNVVVDSAGETKLIDFGMCTRLESPVVDISNSHQQSNCPYVSDKGHSVSPDLVCSSGVDIYQFGLVFARLLVPKIGPEVIDKCPRNSTEMRSRVLAHPQLQECKPDGVDLLQQCLRSDPHTRPTALQALHHPFLRQ